MVDPKKTLSAPELRWPLRDPAAPIADASARRERVWRRVEAKLERSRPRLTPAPFGTTRKLWIGVGAVTASALLFLGVLLSRSVQIGAEHFAGLRTLDQRPFDELAVPEGSAATSVLLAGGVEITATGGTQLTTLAASEREVVLQLRSGGARFSVPPSTGRHWVVEAGLATIDVVGTVFEVTREAHRVTVSVSRGVVLVRSAHVQDGVARVEAGSNLDIYEPKVQALAPSEPPAAASVAGSLSPAPQPSAAPYKPAPPSALLVPISADELLARADAARLAGDLTLAEESLQRMVSTHPGDPRRASAVFTLGVVQSQAHKPMTLVAATFRQALSLTNASSLREDCYQRLIEAELASGQRQNAERSSRRYEAEFPQGRHRERLRRMLASFESERHAP
jgi:transmembrane sensor